MAKKQRNIDSPKKVSKRSVKKRAKELKSYQAAKKSAAEPVNVLGGEELYEKPATTYKAKTMPQQIAKFEEDGSEQPMGMKGAAYNLESDLAEQGLRDKPKKKDYLEDYKIVKQTVEGKKPVGKIYSEELRNIANKSENGISSAEDYKRVNDKLVESLGNSGYAPEIVSEGVKVDDEGNPQTPAAQIADNIATASVTDDTKSDEELNAAMEVNSNTNEAVQSVDEEIGKRNKAIAKVYAETNPDGSVKDPSKTTVTGEPAENLVTKEGIALAQDELFEEMAQGNPEWQNMMKEYQRVTRNAKVGGGEPAIEALGLQQYYPDINQPIAKGSYNRATLGSGNIYVAGGGFFPIGVVDARRRALEKAGKAKAKKKQKMMEMMFAQGAIQFQDQIDDMSMEMLTKYGEASGWDWSKMTDMDTELSRNFMKDVVDHKTFAKRTLYVDGIVKELQKADLGKDAVETPEFVRGLMYEYASGSFNMRQWKDNKKRFSYIEKNLRAYDAITYTARQIANDIEDNPDQSLIEMNGSIDPRDAKEAAEISKALHLIQTGDYDERIWAMKKFVDPKRLDAIVWSHINRDNYYLGEGKEGRQRAFDEMKNNILGRMSHSVELQHRLMNQQRSKRALDWANYSLRKKQIVVQPWTEVNNRVNNNDTKGKLADAVESGGDPKSIAESMVAIAESTTGAQSGIDEDGRLYSRLNPPRGKSAKKHNVPVSQTTFDIDVRVQNSKGGWEMKNMKGLTITEAQNAIQSSPKRISARTPKEHYIMSLNPSDVIEGVNLTEGRVMFGNKNEDGTWGYIGTDSDAGDIEQATTVGRNSYGGSVKADVPQFNDKGDPVIKRFYNYVDSSGNTITQSAFTDEDVKRLEKEHPDGNVVRKQLTKKVDITLEGINQTESLNDDFGRGTLNDYFDTSPEMKKDIEQDESDYDESDNYPDNSGRGYKTYNQKGEIKVYN